MTSQPKYVPCSVCHGSRCESQDPRIKCARCAGEGVIQAQEEKLTAPFGWRVEPQRFW